MGASVKAYAKINLLLDVLGKRADGYHEVKMVMQSINLHDQIYLEASDKNQLLTQAAIPNDQNNLAMKAVLLLQEYYPALPPIAIRLEKHIPVAAGLAGGSSDAAAVLLGVKTLFDLDCSLEELQRIAAKIGSDVPFCLLGETALASGRGEIVTPLAEAPKLYFVLVKPEFGVSTASIYHNFDASANNKHPDFAAYSTHLAYKDGEKVLASMSNALEQSTFQLHPAVAKIKTKMQALGGKYTLMSGSGPTVFSGFSEKQAAEDFFRLCQSHFKQVFLTETVSQTDLKKRVMIDE